MQVHQRTNSESSKFLQVLHIKGKQEEDVLFPDLFIDLPCRTFSIPLYLENKIMKFFTVKERSMERRVNKENLKTTQ